jgi:hypothetical protein
MSQIYTHNRNTFHFSQICQIVNTLPQVNLFLPEVLEAIALWRCSADVYNPGDSGKEQSFS